MRIFFCRELKLHAPFKSLGTSVPGAKGLNRLAAERAAPGPPRSARNLERSTSQGPGARPHGPLKAASLAELKGEKLGGKVK